MIAAVLKMFIKHRSNKSGVKPSGISNGGREIQILDPATHLLSQPDRHRHHGAGLADE
jgi:hypothetical protein